jgi:hypothetical protein
MTNDEIRAMLASQRQASTLAEKPHDHAAFWVEEVERAVREQIQTTPVEDWTDHIAAVEEWIDRHGGYRHVQPAHEHKTTTKVYALPATAFWFIPRSALGDE